MVQTVGVANIGVDFSQGLNALTRGFERRGLVQREEQQRTREEQQREGQAQDLAGSLGLIFNPPPDTPPASQTNTAAISSDEQQTQLNRIGTLEPRLAASINQSIENNDVEGLIALRQRAEGDIELTDNIRNAKSFSEKQKAITKASGKAAARGEDVLPFVDMLNLSEGELDTMALRGEVIRNDLLGATQSVAPIQAEIKQVSDAVEKQEGRRLTKAEISQLSRAMIDNPGIAPTLLKQLGVGVTPKAPTTREIKRGDELVTQQFNQGTGQFEDIATAPRSAQAIKPQTPIGKARQDLKEGLITQKDFNQINKAPSLEFKTSVGKLIGDRKLAIDTFGEGSEQVKAIEAALKAETKGEPPSLTDAAGIRKEFTKASGDFIKLRDAIGKVRVAAANPSGPGDIALIFNFMKILDPGSTVREGEFATAQNSAGVGETVRAQFNRLLEGERLGENQRDEFIKTSNQLFDSQVANQIQLENSFAGIAERAGIKREDVIVDYKLGAEQPNAASGVNTGTLETMSNEDLDRQIEAARNGSIPTAPRAL